MLCEKITAPLQRLLLQIKKKTLCSKIIWKLLTDKLGL